MCGLAFAFSKKGNSAGQQVFNLYKKQESRGKQGYGFISIHKGKLVGLHRAKEEVGIRDLLLKDKSELVMFHHRYPTSTKNTLGTTHPMFVSNKELEHDYYFAHNGIISNARTLKGKHEALGYEYETELTEKTYAEYNNGNREEMSSLVTVFNDSESLAIELARFAEGLTDKISTEGPVAYWGISLKKGTNEVVDVFFGKNKGRDLCVKDNKKWYMVSSITGQDIRDMKFFSFPIAEMGSVLYERDLEIDEAEPVVVRTTPSESSHSTNHMGFDRERVRNNFTRTHELEERPEVKNYDKLENRYYTLTEAVDTDVPFSEFAPMMYHGKRWYLPMKFAGQMDDRPAPTGAEMTKALPAPKDTTIFPSVKEMELLESYVNKWVEVDDRIDSLDLQFNNSKISRALYDRLTDEYALEAQGYEESISALGIDEEIVDEVMDTAKQLYDYEQTLQGMSTIQLTEIDQ